MKNLVFIDNEPFTKRRDQLFYISKLKSEGIGVQVWDLSSFFPAARNVPDIVDADYVIIIKSIEDLNTKIIETNREETCFFVETVLNQYSRPIYNLLTHNNCYILRCNFYSNTIDGASFKLGTWVPWRIKMFLRRMEIIYSFYVNRKKWNGIKVDSYLTPLNEYGATGPINHPDYNDYKFKIETPYLDYPYIVFCDQYFPFHPELNIYVDQIDAQKYYCQMRALFDYVEKVTGMPVVIAAHPKANYTNNEFGDRLIIKYKTNNLVKYSNKVIFHSSNSISYAVLADKEILCIVTDDFMKVSFYSFLQGLSTVLHLKVNNLDRNNVETLRFEKISPKLRAKYIYSYLTSIETENIDNYTILKNAILSAKK